MTGLANGVGFGPATGTQGLTDAEAKQQASYVGWDFTNIWAINEGTGYPYLR